MQHNTKKKKKIQSKNGQKTKTNISPKKTYKWSTNKRCSTLFIIREIKIKATMRYHLSPVRMTVIKKSTNNK